MKQDKDSKAVGKEMLDKEKVFVDADRPVTVFNTAWRKDTPFNNWREISPSLKGQKKRCKMYRSLSEYVKTDSDSCRNSFHPSETSSCSNTVNCSGVLRWLFSLGMPTIDVLDQQCQHETSAENPSRPGIQCLEHSGITGTEPLHKRVCD